MPVQVILAPFLAAHLQILLQHRLEVLHEGAAAADIHFKEQRLALLEREAAIAAHRLVAPLERQSQVVHGVSGLVNGAEQTGERIIGVEARGDADVARYAFGEGMLALIEPPPIEWEPQGFEHVERELALAGHAELAGQRQAAHGRLALRWPR